jgi:hypothetical protein
MPYMLFFILASVALSVTAALAILQEAKREPRHLFGCC